MKDFPLIFELSQPGRRGVQPPKVEGPELAELLGADNLRGSSLDLPEVDELSVVRHYTGLSRRQVGVDTTFYPLGSCTMKYNPKINEEIVKEFYELHPYQDPGAIQGVLRVYHELQGFLAELTGMDSVSLQPAAGAQGELTGILMIRAYHAARGDDQQRRVVLVPDSAHGSNPATAAMAGYQVIEVPSGPDGQVDLAALQTLLSPEVAAVMLTNPNTLGIFEERILEISQLAHAAGAQLYYDGANLNALMGWVQIGKLGFDVAHLNLHKTFSVPHGGGGPGSGPVAAKSHLAPFLPVPLVNFGPDGYQLDYDRPQSIGSMRSFFGNTGAIVRAWAYIRMLGSQGIKKSAALAVLNSSYLKHLLAQIGYTSPYGESMHEFVAQPPQGLSARTVAKALLDRGFHPPTVYFPLIVKEALMIEPTETEAPEVLADFAQALAEIAALDPTVLAQAPQSTPVGQLDETTASRHPQLAHPS